MKAVPPIAMTHNYGPPSMEGSVKNAAAAKVFQPDTKLRGEFKKALESRVNTWMGVPGTAGRQRMEQILSSLMDKQTGKLDLSKLDDQTRAELKKLQGAAEGFESTFVKQLIGEMRKSSFAEKDSAGMGLAKDLIDQQIADSTAKGPHGLGIAQMVFSTMGEQVVRKAAAKPILTSAASDAAQENTKN